MVVTNYSTSGGYTFSRIILYVQIDKSGSTNSDLVFTVLHLKNLKNGAMISDGEYKLFLYKMEHADFRKVKDYFKWPFINYGVDASSKNKSHSTDESGFPQYNPKDFLILQTKLVATNLTTNGAIQTLKYFKNYIDSTDFDQLLSNLMYCTPDELQLFFYEMIFNVVQLGEYVKVNFKKQLRVIINTLAVLTDKNTPTELNKFRDGLETMESTTFKKYTFKCFPL